MPLSVPSHTKVFILRSSPFPVDPMPLTNTEKPCINSYKYLSYLRCSHFRVPNSLRAKKHTIFAFFYEMWKSDNRGLKSFGHLCNWTDYLWFNKKKKKKGAAFLLRTVCFSPPLHYNVENQKKLQVAFLKIVYSESWEDTAADRSRWRSVLHK